MPTLTAKIEKQLEGLNAKVERLSGNYLTNTPRRQRQQKERDRQIAEHTAHIHILQYLQEKELAEGLTHFETALTTGAIYESLRYYSAYAKHLAEHRLPGPKYPFEGTTDYQRLQRAGVKDLNQLLDAIAQFNALREKALVPPDTRALQIRDLTYQAQMMQGGDIQFSPPELVSEMLAAVHLDGESRVLEPEAGSGRIADAVKAITPHVDCVEWNYALRKLLELKGHHLIGDDFLELDPQPVYDAVLMNPPFSQECEHIQHAFQFLRPGGTLVSVCIDRIFRSEQRKFKEFQDWLAEHTHSVQKLQNIKFEMTGVSTMLLMIYKGNG